MSSFIPMLVLPDAMGLLGPSGQYAEMCKREGSIGESYIMELVSLTSVCVITNHVQSVSPSKGHSIKGMPSASSPLL